MSRYQLRFWSLVALLCLPTLAWAQSAKDRPDRRAWWQEPRFAQELALGPEEIGRLDELHLAYQQQLITLRAELSQERLLMDRHLDQEPLDDAALQADLERMAGVQAKIYLSRSQFFLEVRKLLGLERFGKLKALFAETRAQRRQADESENK